MQVAATTPWERKLAAYVAAGGAVLFASDNAQAAPIYSGIQDVPIGAGQMAPLDLNGDAVVDFNFFHVVDPSPLLFVQGTGTNGMAGVLLPPVPPVTDGSAAFLLEAGVPLPGTQKFLGGPLPVIGETGYLGLEFDILGARHYGWARLSVGQDATATIHDWAYEGDPGATILTGQTQVPEPSSLALLALGAAGLAAARARRERG
jgi:hypothetical protein